MSTDYCFACEDCEEYAVVVDFPRYVEAAMDPDHIRHRLVATSGTYAQDQLRAFLTFQKAHAHHRTRFGILGCGPQPYTEIYTYAGPDEDDRG